jgi:hypothetical protein
MKRHKVLLALLLILMPLPLLLLLLSNRQSLVSIPSLENLAPVKSGFSRIDSSSDQRIWEIEHYVIGTTSPEFTAQIERELKAKGFRRSKDKWSSHMFENSQGVIVDISKGKQCTKIDCSIGRPPTQWFEMKLIISKLLGRDRS